MGEHPKVSLVMKVYNGEQYLQEAIDSILNQTFTDFELVIINDGSTDDSEHIIKSYKDVRIRYLKNEKNLGLCLTQNKVIAQARGEYIAVMDCDDISYPTRFEKQVRYLDNHPKVIMCGTQRNNLVDGKESPFRRIEALDNCTLRYSMVFGQYFLTHSSIMFRAKEYRENGFAYGGVTMAEDYQIMVEMAKRFEVAILPERLVAYRIYPQSTSKMSPQEIIDGAATVKCRYLESLPIQEEEKQCLIRYFKSERTQEEPDLFLQAVKSVAGVMEADISKGGNGYPITCEIIREFLMKQKEYSITLWRKVRRWQFAGAVCLNTVFGWKFLIACLLHIKR